MKRILSLIILLSLLLGCILPAALAADMPNPIPVVEKENRTPTPKGVHHYMLICVDSWDAKGSFAKKQWGNHTDGLMLVTVDENAQRVMLTSFIRDMLIQRPDGKFGRINNFLDVGGWCYENGKTYNEGFHALVETINGHFDLNIEKFIVVDFRQVENIINAVGGVDINITNREATYLKRYSISSTSTLAPITANGVFSSWLALEMKSFCFSKVSLTGFTSQKANIIAKRKNKRIVITPMMEVENSRFSCAC